MGIIACWKFDEYLTMGYLTFWHYSSEFLIWERMQISGTARYIDLPKGAFCADLGALNVIGLAVFHEVLCLSGGKSQN